MKGGASLISSQLTFINCRWEGLCCFVVWSVLGVAESILYQATILKVYEFHGRIFGVVYILYHII